jgi:hypothetical protein
MYDDIAEYKRMRNEFSQILPEAYKEGTGELYIIVIGESETRDLMGAYSRLIGNTPWLDMISPTTRLSPISFFLCCQREPGATPGGLAGVLKTPICFAPRELRI